MHNWKHLVIYSTFFDEILKIKIETFRIQIKPNKIYVKMNVIGFF